MEALSKHANIQPVITSTGQFSYKLYLLPFIVKFPSSCTIIILYYYTFTVWAELEKENKEFFKSYSPSQIKEARDRMTESETSELIQKMISDAPKDSDDH